MERNAVDGRVVHAYNFIRLPCIATLCGSHEEAAADRQIPIMEEMGKEALSITYGLVRLVHDAEVKSDSCASNCLRQSLTALVGGEDNLQALWLLLQPSRNLL